MNLETSVSLLPNSELGPSSLGALGQAFLLKQLELDTLLLVLKTKKKKSLSLLSSYEFEYYTKRITEQ